MIITQKNAGSPSHKLINRKLTNMKVTTLILTGSAVIVSALLTASCVKPTGQDVGTMQSDFSNKAFIQVYNAAAGTSRNYVYVDGNPVSGALMAYGGAFPNTASPANFAFTSGTRAFLIRDTSSTILTQPSLSFGEDLMTGKYYGIIMYDTATTVKQKTFVNNIIIPDDTTARLRFANFVYNAPGAAPPASGPPMASAYDVFSVKRNANIFTNVQNTEMTDYIPYASALTDTFYIRPTGTTTNLQNFVPTPAPGSLANIQTTLNPTRKRSYTLIFRGGYRTYTSTGATVRTLSTFVNY
jgi:hypothetical protein